MYMFSATKYVRESESEGSDGGGGKLDGLGVGGGLKVFLLLKGMDIDVTYNGCPLQAPHIQTLLTQNVS